MGTHAMIDRRRAELAAGAAAGLLGGALFAVAMQEQGMTVDMTGLAGFESRGAELLAHLLLAALGGAAFAAIFRYQPGVTRPRSPSAWCSGCCCGSSGR